MVIWTTRGIAADSTPGLLILRWKVQNSGYPFFGCGAILPPDEDMIGVSKLCQCELTDSGYAVGVL